MTFLLFFFFFLFMAALSLWIFDSSLFFFLFRLYLEHLEVPMLGVELQLQLLAYAPATAIPDPSRVYVLHHSSQQHRILKPLSMARDWTFILMDTSQVHYCWATMETLTFLLLTLNCPSWYYAGFWVNSKRDVVMKKHINYEYKNVMFFQNTGKI